MVELHLYKTPGPCGLIYKPFNPPAEVAHINPPKEIESVTVTDTGTVAVANPPLEVHIIDQTSVLEYIYPRYRKPIK